MPAKIRVHSAFAGEIRDHPGHGSAWTQQPSLVYWLGSSASGFQRKDAPVFVFSAVLTLLLTPAAWV